MLQRMLSRGNNNTTAAAAAAATDPTALAVGGSGAVAGQGDLSQGDAAMLGAAAILLSVRRGARYAYLYSVYIVGFMRGLGLFACVVQPFEPHPFRLLPITPLHLTFPRPTNIKSPPPPHTHTHS